MTIVNIFKQMKLLREKGVLGMNARNAEYVLPNNERHLYPLVDDKVKTKQLAMANNIPVPKMYYVVKSPREIKNDFFNALKPYKDFAIKPAHGQCGEGIIIVTDVINEHYKLIDGTRMTKEDLSYAVSTIMSGVYSLGGQQDEVLVEYRIKFDPVFDEITFRGVPDIRVITYRGVPTMSMLRLPTSYSNGKANLHQDGIGVGVNISTGKSMKAVFRNQIITIHPDTFVDIQGIQIPYWDRILELATRSYDMTGLVYQGVDIVIDKDLGPLILELNARPGLNIQIANQTGIRPRLELIDEHKDEFTSLESRIEFAKKNFR
ncbi:MAG: alpha-L-glutamate ligase-like protein [Bdellovibrionota bacterium]|nr:alpha-L-glutamate ligase-like protein [Pseudomonadota bacterium]MDY6090660.1 alpha-L-glutamate ligase-like protein [Bdellovibrionota bacterium]